MSQVRPSSLGAFLPPSLPPPHFLPPYSLSSLLSSILLWPLYTFLKLDGESLSVCARRHKGLLRSLETEMPFSSHVTTAP